MWPHFLLETHKKEGGGDDVSLFARMDRSVRFPLPSPLVGLLHWSRVNCRVLCCRRSAPASPSLPSVPSSSFLATRSPPPPLPPLGSSRYFVFFNGHCWESRGRRREEVERVEVGCQKSFSALPPPLLSPPLLLSVVSPPSPLLLLALQKLRR